MAPPAEASSGRPWISTALRPRIGPPSVGSTRSSRPVCGSQNRMMLSSPAPASRVVPRTVTGHSVRTRSAVSKLRRSVPAAASQMRTVRSAPELATMAPLAVSSRHSATTAARCAGTCSSVAASAVTCRRSIVPSWPPVTISSAPQPTAEVTLPSRSTCRGAGSRPGVHTVIVPSAQTMPTPSAPRAGLAVSARTWPASHCSECRACPLSGSHRMTRPSAPAEAISVRPSADTGRSAITGPPASMTRSGWAVFGFHTRTVPSDPPVASTRPRLRVRSAHTASTALVCPSSTAHSSRSCTAAQAAR